MDSGLNSVIKKVRQVGAGFRSFANYRLRILLVVGGCDWSLLGLAPAEIRKQLSGGRSLSFRRRSPPVSSVRRDGPR